MRDPDKQCAVGEGQHLDRKSLRIVTGKTANFSELAQECVCFANGSGGRLLLGIKPCCAGTPPAAGSAPRRSSVHRMGRSVLGRL